MSKTIHPLDYCFKQLWQSFLANYGGLRLFSEQLPAVADRLDEKVMEEMAETVADTFGDPIEQVRTELGEFLPSLDDEHLYPDFYNQPDVREVFAAFQDTAFRRSVLKWAREEPLKAHRFFNEWADIMAQPPLSGVVLRQSVLINLVSTLEIFVDGLLKEYGLRVLPESNIPERLDWRQRWKHLEAIYPAQYWHPKQDVLREVIARRNALVHQGGRITKDGYLKQTQKIPSRQPDGVAEGRFLLVPSQYLQEAFDTSILFAFALSQAAWRKWRKPHHPKNADEILGQLVYQTLRQKRYTLVEEMAKVALEFKPKNKYTQLIQVNWAIACREQGNRNNMNALLEKLEKRKKRGWNITLAIAVLREQNEDVERLLRAAHQKGVLKEISPYWPLFDLVRSETWFKNAFAVKYGELPKKR